MVLIRISIGIFLLIVTSCTTPSVIATQAIQRGDAANNQNKYEDAITYYEEYLSLSPQLGLYRNLKMESDVNRKLAHAYATQGKYRQSIQQLNKALLVDSVQGHTLEFIDDHRQLGMVQGYSGDFHASRYHLQRSLSLNEGLEKSMKDSKRGAAADTYMSLAQLEMTLGNFKKSREFTWKALNIYLNMTGEFVGVIEAKLLLGILARETGQLDQAEKWIKESQLLSKNNNLSISRHAQALGEISFLKGDPEGGIRYKLLAVDEAEKTNIKPQVMMAYMRLGDGYQRLGDQVRANFYYRKAMSVQAGMESDTLGFAPSLNLRLGDVQKAYDYYLQAGSATGLALVSLRLGEYYYQKNVLDSAASMYEQAKTSFSNTGSKEGVAKANIELAKVLIQMSEFSTAEELLNESNRLTIQQDLKWQVFLRKGIVKEHTNSVDSAYACYKTAIDIINDMRGNITIEEFKTLFTNTKVEVYDRMIQLLLKKYKSLSGYTYEKSLLEAFGYNEQSRSRAFLDMLGNRKMESKSAQDNDLLEEEQLLKLKIQQLSVQLSNTQLRTTRHQLNNELVSAQHEYDNLLQKIKLSNNEYATVMSVDPKSIQEIQSKLDNTTAIIEYWMGEESLISWVITKEKISASTINIPRKDLQREITACRRAISLHVADVVSESLKKLNNILISPIQDKLAGYKNLIIIPHRDLHFLPFQALELTTNKFLVEQYIISYSPSASILYYCLSKTPQGGNKFLGLALGDISIGNFPGLPGTEDEVKQLVELYPAMISRSKEEFSETYLKAHATNQNYIHLATHGVFNKTQPLYSYLLMSSSEQDDGRLTVDEIFSMNLNTKFVTLSACETALGDIGEGDDLVGLSRAFMYAGSPGVIVSLWKVDDATTAWLMARFHQYISGGFTSSESLTFAQRDMIQRKFIGGQARGLKHIELAESIQRAINNDETAHNPYYWAPFVLIGNGFVR